MPVPIVVDGVLVDHYAYPARVLEDAAGARLLNASVTFFASDLVTPLVSRNPVTGDVVTVTSNNEGTIGEQWLPDPRGDLQVSYRCGGRDNIVLSLETAFVARQAKDSSDSAATAATSAGTASDRASAASTSAASSAADAERSRLAAEAAAAGGSGGYAPPVGGIPVEDLSPGLRDWIEGVRQNPDKTWTPRQSVTARRFILTIPGSQKPTNARLIGGTILPPGVDHLQLLAEPGTA